MRGSGTRTARGGRTRAGASGALETATRTHRPGHSSAAPLPAPPHLETTPPAAHIHSHTRRADTHADIIETPGTHPTCPAPAANRACGLVVLPAPSVCAKLPQQPIEGLSLSVSLCLSRYAAAPAQRTSVQPARLTYAATLTAWCASSTTTSYADRNAPRTACQPPHRASESEKTKYIHTPMHTHIHTHTL
jgi:hypothetical protein